MTQTVGNPSARKAIRKAHANDGYSAPTCSSQQTPGLPCNALCAAPVGREEALCPGVGASTDGTIGRSGFLRDLGALVGATAFAGAASSFGALLSPAVGALAAGKSKLAVAGPGLWLGNARGLAPAQALAYKDPGSGDPALLMRLANGQFVSYDAGCTHGTCTVAYDPRRSLMVCPCHGATFDPAHNAAVLVGPAKDPLYKLPIHVDASGDVYYLAAQPGPRINRLSKAPPYTGQSGDDSGGGDDGGGGNGPGGDTLVRQLGRRTKPLRVTSGRDD